MMLDKIGWKVNRLRTMNLPEIGYRVKQAWQIRRETLGGGLASTPPPMQSRAGMAWLAELPHQFDMQPYCAAADRVLEGRFDIFSMHDIALGFPPQWNRDPKTGTDAPLVHGKRLNYRDEETVGDIKYLWEPNRHLHVTVLAQAYHLSGDVRYAEGVRTMLDSWFTQCPYPLGPNWVSSLELAIRLVNWSFTWHLLGGEHSPLFSSPDGMRFKRRWLNSIYQHCHFIAGYLSRYSSANNHLFGELAGLYAASLTWPCWSESQSWLRLAREELELEARKQNNADGVNCEQAIYYHHEVADMMLVCWLIGRANGSSPSSGFIAILEKMLEFIASIMDTAGNMPMIGDADDALLVQWSQNPHWNPYRSLLATGAVLFNRPDFKFKAGSFDDKSRWLLGDAAAQYFESMPCSASAAPIRREFRDGGYFILGDRFHTPEEIRMVADAGPLGYLSIAAHGHADALAFTLSVGGMPMLIDPGTYAYHTQKKWRDYFRGTSAHNTVRVDGVDQSEPGGNFMWLRKANARCEVWESSASTDCFVGSHDGYARLPDPVIHRRKIQLMKDERKIVVEDILECRGAHDIEFHWHFPEHCEIELDARVVRASYSNVGLEFTMPGCHCMPELISGRECPPLGWISRRMDQKVPSPSIVWREKISGTTRRITVFQIGID